MRELLAMCRFGVCACWTKVLDSTVLLKVVFCFYVMSSSVNAQLNSNDIQLLTSAINKNRSNNESIRTWTGTAVYENTVFSEDNKLTRNRKSKILFAVDKANASRFSLSRTDVDFSIVDGVKKEKQLEISGFMQIADTVHRYQARDVTGFGSDGDLNSLDMVFFRGTLVISPVDVGSSKNFILDDFDPFWGYKFTNNDTSAFFSKVVKYEASSKLDYVPTVQRTGDVVTYRQQIATQGGGVLLNEYSSDLLKGACLVQCTSSLTNSFETHWSAKLEQVSGVWVPKEVVQSIDYGRNKTKVTFIDNKINEDIPDSTFTLKNLGVRNGDGLVDMRTGQNSVINDKSLPELELPDIRRQRFNYVRYVLMSLGAIIVLIALFRAVASKSCSWK